MNYIIPFIAGLLFSFGLIFSSMIDHKKVLAFLDLFGNWDPSLAFVMVGAISFNFISFKFIFKRSPLYTHEHNLPQSSEITPELILGASLFGLGWGTLGLCPGPALVNLVTLNQDVFIFVISMVIGMALYSLRQILKL